MCHGRNSTTITVYELFYVVSLSAYRFKIVIVSGVLIITSFTSHCALDSSDYFARLCSRRDTKINPFHFFIQPFYNQFVTSCFF